jgi:hypothetical protein
LFEADDPKSHFLDRLDTLYDIYVEPIDLPGPDRIVDRLLKRILKEVATMVFDAVASRMSEAEPTPDWPALPADTNDPAEGEASP